MYIQQNLLDGSNAEYDDSISIIDLVLSGGTASIIIIVILLVLFTITIFIYFERYIAIRDAAETDDKFMMNIKDAIANGDINRAKILCANTDIPIARLLEKGIARLHRPMEDIRKAIESAGTLEVYKLEKNVSLLGTFSGVAPMIGFLGTVIGMIIAFHQMANSGGQAEMGLLASGIYTAMTTTVGGLIVGIIAYLSYNHLVMKTEKILHLLEESVISFMDTLNDPRE